jgi:CMP-2-keto-3-deoxyoctulosonic acid synthetase
LENGISIHVGETPFETVGVDTEEDLRRVEALLIGGSEDQIIGSSDPQNI